jgi:hypothetical protein
MNKGMPDDDKVGVTPYRKHLEFQKNQTGQPTNHAYPSKPAVPQTPPNA